MKFLATVCLIAGSLTQVNGQSPAADTTSVNDRLRQCRASEQLEVIFVGRALDPVTVHVSGEAWIEEARRTLERTKEEVARLRASLDSQALEQMETELVIRVVRAESELMDRRGRSGQPFDMSFVPVQVERAIRGVTESTLMVEWRGGSMAMDTGQSYLIKGGRRKDSMPYARGMPDPFGFNEYVILASAMPIASAQEDLRILASMQSGATILGNVWMARPNNTGVPMGGTRIMVSSGGHLSDVITREDGTFTMSGLQPGHVEIRPLLGQDLTVLNRSLLTFELGENGCRTAELRVALNGRIRGRVISATGSSLAGVELVLQPAQPPDRCCSLGPTTTIRPGEDGTYEFFGQGPGSYLLSVSQTRVENDKERRLVTYYPGTADAAEAVPIVIGHATQQDGFDFLVKTE